MRAHQYTPLRDRARGQWHGILISIGIDARFLTRRNCPCPMCGGKDRFRFLDTNGDGTWICNNCGTGAGTDLAMRLLRTEFREIALRIEQIIGDPQRPIPVIKLPTEKANASSYARRVWQRGSRVISGDIVDRYLHSRGIGMDLYPSCLRTSALDWYRDNETDAMSQFPAMLALICGADDKPVAVHRTFLAEDGCRKAPVSNPRKVAGRFGNNPTIRLSAPGETLGIAEGIETALAAAQLFRVPTWAVISTYGISTFEVPPKVSRLIIFADNDANGAGQNAAQDLAARLTNQITVELQMPNNVGTDWNDELIAYRGGK
jgi:putative DNA primase/helicase